MSTPRQLNPAETAMFEADLARLPPPHRADIVLGWRERCVALAQKHMSVGADGLAILAGGAYCSAIGAWDGVSQYKRDWLITEWQQTTAPSLGIDPNQVRTPFQDVYDANGKLVHKKVRDPRAWLWFNNTLYPTAAFAMLAGFGVGGPFGNRFLVAPVIGGVGYVLGSWFRDKAYSMVLEHQASKLPTNGTVNGTTNGGTEGNPYRGFPRAA